MERKEALKSSKKRRVLAIVLMVVCLLGSLAFMQKYLCIPYDFDQNRAIMIHKEPDNSIDVLLIGSSATYSGFSSVYAYEQFGFTSFPYAIGGATCTSWKPAVQDALNTQRPKLIVVDVFGGGYDLDLVETRNIQFYTILSHTALSSEKIATAKKLSENVNGTSASSLLMPILKYHDRAFLNLMTIKDTWSAFHADASYLKGVEVITRMKKTGTVADESLSDESVPLDDKTEAIINDFIEYCKSENLNVLFVKYPTVLTKNNREELDVNLRANRILELADEAGFATLNMQKRFYDIGLIENEDYYNHGHTNTRGQKKVTKYLGDYIQNSLGVGPSELSEDNKKAWDDCIPYYNTYCDLVEVLIDRKKDVDLGDCPELINDLERIINGTDINEIADKCKPKE